MAKRTTLKFLALIGRAVLRMKIKKGHHLVPLVFCASDYPILWTFMVANLAVGIVLLYHGLGLGSRLGSGLALQRSLSLGWGLGRSLGLISGLGPRLLLLLGLQLGLGVSASSGLLLLLIL